MTRLGEKKVRLTAVSAAIPGGGFLARCFFFVNAKSGGFDWFWFISLCLI